MLHHFDVKWHGHRVVIMNMNDMKERFSLAYVEAVASQAGYSIVDPRIDRDSVDGFLKGDQGRRPRIEFQAKATSQDVLRDDQLHFPLPIGNYNDLRVDTIVPRILIVLRMPTATGDWLKQTPEELCLHYCAYWLSLEGRPAVPNTSSVTVRLPLANMFSSKQLTDMMGRVDRGESL